MQYNVSILKIAFPLLQLVNRYHTGFKIDLESKISSSILSFDQDSKRGICGFVFLIEDDDKKFKVAVEMNADFSVAEYDGDENALQKAVQKEAFPYIRAAISNLTSVAFLPPIVISNIQSDDEAKNNE